MRYGHIAGLVFNHPLLIEPGAFNAVLAFLMPRMKGETSAQEPGPVDSARRNQGPQASYESYSSLDDGRSRSYKVLPNGIAIIPIEGYLVNRSMPMDALSGGPMTYTSIGARLNLCLADPGVRGILLDVDSPGGMVSGFFELAEKIRQSASQKPIWGLANADAYSAAYGLTSAAQKLFVVKSGGVGSIGVIWQYMDQTALDASLGLKYGVLKAGARKNDFNPHFEVTPEALAWGQAEVERVYGEFCGLVARHRPGLSAEAARATEAGLYFGENAVKAGLADGVSTLDKVLEDFEAALSAKTQGGGAAAGRATAGTDMEANMSDKQNKDKPAAKAETPGEVKDQASQPEPEAVDQKARIQAILASPEAKGREGLAKHLAFATDMTPEAAEQVLAASPQAASAMEARADDLGADQDLLTMAMESKGNPKVGADGDQDQNTAEALANSILTAGESGNREVL